MMRRFLRDPRRGWGKRHERKERGRLARRRQDHDAVTEATTPSRALHLVNDDPDWIDDDAE
jgi:hypothetical protein